MKGELVAGGRCPKCTLKPPCKHYSDVGEIMSDPSALPAPPKKSPKKREVQLPDLHASGTDMSIASIGSPTRIFGAASPVKKQAQIAPNVQLHSLSMSSDAAPPVRSGYSTQQQKHALLAPQPASSGFGSTKNSERTAEGGWKPHFNSNLNSTGRSAASTTFAHTVDDKRRSAHSENPFPQEAANSKTPREWGAVGRPPRFPSDRVMVRIRGKNNMVHTKAGSVRRTLAEEAEEGTREKEIKIAQRRLKTLERIEKYREERMQRELEEMEAEKARYDEEMRQLQEKEIKRQKYLKAQKD